MLYVCFYKNLIKALAYLIIILSIDSSKENKQSALDEMVSLLPAPQIVDLKTEEGYIINPVKGDSIQPIINSLGDTVKTGVLVPAKGNVKDPGNSAKLKVISVYESKSVLFENIREGIVQSRLNERLWGLVKELLRIQEVLFNGLDEIEILQRILNDEKA